MAMATAKALEPATHAGGAASGAPVDAPRFIRWVGVVEKAFRLDVSMWVFFCF